MGILHCWRRSRQEYSSTFPSAMAPFKSRCVGLCFAVSPLFACDVLRVPQSSNTGLRIVLLCVGDGSCAPRSCTVMFSAHCWLIDQADPRRVGSSHTKKVVSHFLRKKKKTLEFSCNWPALRSNNTPTTPPNNTTTHAHPRTPTVCLQSVITMKINILLGLAATTVPVFTEAVDLNSKLPGLDVSWTWL